MASHLDIFKFLPKSDCGECGEATCLFFARKVAAGKADVLDCRYVAKKCPKCSHKSDIPFKKCPECGILIHVIRKAEDNEATQCPKCGHRAEIAFEECPMCGVSVGIYVKNARKMGQSGVFEAPEPEEKEPVPSGPVTLTSTDSFQCPYCGFISAHAIRECPECGCDGDLFKIIN